MSQFALQVGVSVIGKPECVWDSKGVHPPNTHPLGAALLERRRSGGVIVSGRVASFPPVELAFAWTQSTEVPVSLEHVNFFMEFDVCFFGSQAAFEMGIEA
jgi:hypothetical protein